MISIITAIYNQRDMNQIFYENLQKYTKNPFELIIIDNGSNDGSREYFESVGATVIANDANYSYPVCQNQGIAVAQYDVYAFLNNDIIVAPNWDEKLIAVMDKHNLEIVSPAGLEQIESKKATKFIRKKWGVIKLLNRFFGNKRGVLLLMHRLMYPNWEAFQQKRYDEYRCHKIEGFVGNSIIMKKSAIEKVGLWDERLLAADFDLYLRSKMRSLSHGDIVPIQVVLGVFHHHYIRLTARTKYPRFADFDNLISLQDKWSEEELSYLKCINV
jgi:GT2 family glycosyltransferase